MNARIQLAVASCHTSCRESLSWLGRLPAVAGLLLALCAGTVHAADLKVVAPNAVKEPVVEAAARFERETGHRIVLSWGGSESISKRLKEGEAFDVVVNTAQSVAQFSTEGLLLQGTRSDLARSAVGVAVRSGLPRPDISSVDALRQTLLSANSIAISSGASGRYLEQLFQRLGVAEQVRPKLKQPASGAQIADLISRGEADLGFQQVTELIHAKGVDYLGTLPDEVQNYTQWSAALHRTSTQADVAQGFLRTLTSPDSLLAFRRMGMQAP